MPNYNYFPATYQPYVPQYNNQNQYAPTPQSNTPSIMWVQGEAGAKSYLVGAGQSVLLMDSESSTFYIKSTDASGMPMPLRIFDYKERQSQQTPAPVAQSTYVTHEEFDRWTSDIMKKISKEDVQNAE